MDRSKEKQAVAIYLPCIDEVVARVEIINTLLRNDAELTPGFIREGCYLHLRAMCEVIAVACIAVHAERSLSARILKEYEAPKVMRALSELHRDFFPKPLLFVRSGDQVKIGEAKGTNHLTQSELVRLWKISGSYLHRTPYKRAVKTFALKESDWDMGDVSGWNQKIVRLLNEHLVVLNDKTAMTGCLKDADTGRPSVQFLHVSEEDGTVSPSRWLYSTSTPKPGSK